MPEKYLGVILWADRDGARGVLADTAGQTWRFSETLPEKIGFGKIPVYENGWRPKVSIGKNPKSGHDFVLTEPEIVEFSIEFFKFRDGRDGNKITSVCAASDYSQEEYDTLSIVRENWEMQKRAERRARHERREAEPKELETRTMVYSPR